MATRRAILRGMLAAVACAAAPGVLAAAPAIAPDASLVVTVSADTAPLLTDVNEVVRLLSELPDGVAQGFLVDIESLLDRGLFDVAEFGGFAAGRASDDLVVRVCASGRFLDLAAAVRAKHAELVLHG